VLPLPPWPGRSANSVAASARRTRGYGGGLMRLKRVRPAAAMLSVVYPSRPQRGRGALMLRSGALRTLLLRYCSTTRREVRSKQHGCLRSWG